MRRLVLVTAGLLLISIGSRKYGDTTAEGTICPVPGAGISEARLLAIERENGCLDDGAGGQDAPSWPPGWKTATIAGGDTRSRADRARRTSSGSRGRGPAGVG